jgi:hypothetical protein
VPRSGVEDTISCRPHRGHAPGQRRSRRVQGIIGGPGTDPAVIAGPHGALLGKISPTGQEAAHIDVLPGRPSRHRPSPRPAQAATYNLSINRAAASSSPTSAPLPGDRADSARSSRPARGHASDYAESLT